MGIVVGTLTAGIEISELIGGLAEGITSAVTGSDVIGGAASTAISSITEGIGDLSIATETVAGGIENEIAEESIFQTLTDDFISGQGSLELQAELNSLVGEAENVGLDTSLFGKIKSKLTLDLLKKVIKDVAISSISIEAGNEVISLITGKKTPKTPTKPKKPKTDSFKLGQKIAKSLNEYITFIHFHYKQGTPIENLLKDGFSSQTDKQAGKEVLEFFGSIKSNEKITDFEIDSLNELAITDIETFDLYDKLIPPEDTSYNPQRNVDKRKFYDTIKNNLNNFPDPPQPEPDTCDNRDLLLAFDGILVSVIN